MLEAQLLRSLQQGGVTQDSWTSAAGGSRSSVRLSPEMWEEMLGRVEMRIDAIDRVLDGNNKFPTQRIVIR